MRDRQISLLSFGIGARLLWAIAFCAALMMEPVGANSAPRVALVVGNGAYAPLPHLLNPPNDAAAVAAALTKIGFDVISLSDATRDSLAAAVDRFGQLSHGADVAVFYYAGHGVQVAGTNYLLPVDATVKSVAELAAQAIDVGRVIQTIKAATPRASVVILDACRDNPLPAVVAGDNSGLQGTPLTSGLARVEGVSGLLIAYATAPGQVAYDGFGGNSPFAAALVHYLDEPGLEIGLLFRRVRQRVMETTAGAQIPWVEEALLEPLYMHPAAAQGEPATDVARLNGALEIEQPELRLAALVGLASAPTDPSIAPVIAGHIERLRNEQPAETPTDRLVKELVDWHRLRTIQSRPAARLAATAFLKLHADGIFADRARGYVEGEAVAGGVGQVSDADAESVWTLIERLDDAALLDRLIELVPSGRIADLAQARRQINLASQAVAPTSPVASLAPLPTQEPATATAPDQRAAGNTSAGQEVMPVFVGTGPAKIALAATPALVRVASPPRFGALIAEHEDGTVSEIRGAGDGSPTAVRALFYRPDPETRDAVDEFVIATALPSDRGLAVAEAQLAQAASAPAVAAPTGPAPPPAIQTAGSQSQVAEPAPSQPAAAQEAPTAAQSAPPPTVTQVAEVPAPMTVRADIKPHDCDMLAGARFDTQGVVIGIYPNEIEPKRAIAACRQAVDAFPDVPRFRYQLARALDVGGEHDAAIALYREAAGAGYVAALYELGTHYQSGDGVPRDLDEAIRLYKGAAGKGDLYAATRLGLLYRDGIGVARDVKTAISWLLQAARGGHTFAYNHLGYMYLKGDGVERDYQRAFGLFQASADAGDIYGYNNMGLMYERGLFVSVDPAKAIGWYEKAARGGQPQAPINLGLMYLGDHGVPADPVRAAYWFAEAAKLGNAWGFTNLGWLYQTGKGVDSNPELSAELYARALRLDPNDAGAAASKNFANLPKKAAVRAIQKRLIALGLQSGEADGRWGQRTRDAIRAFARNAGLDLRDDAPQIRILASLIDAADHPGPPGANAN